MKVKLYFLFEVTLKEASEIGAKELVDWWDKRAHNQLDYDEKIETIKLKQVSLYSFDCERYNYENYPFHVYFEKEYNVDVDVV